jgi:hypothetical protein
MEQYKGYEIEIEQDTEPMSPRDWDNLGTMVLMHKRYNLPNETDYKSEHFCSWDELYEQIEADNKNAIILPVRMYDHSGIALSTSYEYPFNCQWDSGQVGFIFVPLETVRKEYGVKRVTKALRQKMATYLQGEVRVYSEYVSGDVWGYRIYKNGEEVDSCWGFFGDGAESAAKEVIDSYGDVKELMGLINEEVSKHVTA